MSTTDPRADESTDRPSLERAQYARRDWWGEDDADDEPTPDETDAIGRDPNGNTVTEQKIESLAHLWLKQTSEDPFLDPVALCEPPEDGMHDREGIRADLTDPEVYPPTADGPHVPQKIMERKAPSSKRWRYSEEYGHLTYGGIIPDRPKADLLELVGYVTANIAAVDVPPRNQRLILEGAETLKRRDELHDVQIMRRVAEWIFLPKQLHDDADRDFRRY
ncbi:hypothetical protein [Halopiger xanaduensis]|uniref:Uncharacterized protein n=1 Tax=Halopiger xanaduensis (strain DSM 18323 / JCM 14033 / SH-6) TaxID=797210 RepID=F8DEV5_HALXS|nr:hypothetical protein [Halopiger xanaduensis]AEH39545.1 hypothetical protein Halxa_0306 [Halopiger xanaduensis SH-6]